MISLAINYTRTFSPSLILEARFGVSWYHNVAISQADGLKTSEEVGIKGVNVDDSSDGLTRIEINRFTSPVVGFSPSLPWDRGETTANYNGTLTKLSGIVKKGGLSNYDITNNTLQVSGFGGVPFNVGVKNYYKNFAPRLGAAFRFNDKTVLRAGFGTSIIPFPDNRYAFNFPVKQNNQFNPANPPFGVAGSMAAGLPAPQVFSVPDSGIIQANTSLLLNAGFFYAPPDLKEGKIHSYNVAFQRELWFGFSGEVAYVGNRATGILTDFDLNAATTLGQGNAGRPFNQKFGKNASVRTWLPTDSHYNSLQVKVDRCFKQSWLVTTSYTVGRAINFSDDNGGFGTPADLSLSEGRAGFDRRQMFTGSFVWDIPFANKSNGFIRAIFGGWQVSGILVSQTGTPINFTANGNALNAPGNTQRPNLNGEPKVFGKIGPGSLYFDTSVFSAPAGATFGNMKRNDSITGPGYLNLDGTLIKRFKFTERIGGELRADALNVTNSPHFNNPDGNLANAATFGQVGSGSAFGQRSIRFGARITF